VAASHPGFGASPRPHSCDTVDDLAYVYLDLLEELDLTDVVVVGVSFGGWIAAELATKGSDRIAKLVLINALGVKFGDRETRDIVDIFGTTIEDISSLFFADAARGSAVFGEFNFKDMEEESVLRFTRNREALLLYGWSPTLYNPKLKDRLRRIKAPTLVIWGAQDKVTPPSYGRRYAEAIPGAAYEEVEQAGHYGYLERPEPFADRILAFAKN
jgi:pimeloyl-ACP methyl ester carboxylesterase